MEKLGFEEWAQQLEKVSHLKDEHDCKIYWELIDSITGEESLDYANKLIDTIILPEDYEVYESTYNALWSFPPKAMGKLLGERLPEFQRRMGRYGQVQRFYFPIINQGDAQDAFVDAAKKWEDKDKRTAMSALKKWAEGWEEWEPLLDRLGKPLAKVKEDPIPDNWPDDWKKRLKSGRESEGEFSISEKFWKGGIEKWKADLDFLIEVCSMNHGKKWRQIDTITNPFWFFAHKTMYPEFVKRIKLLDENKRSKLLNNLKKVNKRKYAELVANINIE